MSQPPKKTKKGRAPAHQNTFAFRHNPKSKKTAKILGSPVDNCCRRCRDKIVWRKTYRKYKPLTQPATCNQCHCKTITSAYHTICKRCATDSVAFRKMRETYPDATHACEVCAKVPFDDDNNHDGDSNEDADGGAIDAGIDLGRRLKLREVKALERQQQRKEMGDKHQKEGLSSSQSEEDEETAPEPALEDGVPHQSEYVTDDSDEEDDEDDPFLAAIGGKFLTGKAYQDQLLHASESAKRE
jgi:Uncharacterized conserved protein (DUF2039)